MLRRLAWSLTAAQIAVTLGRTVLAVRTKAAHERIRLRPDPEQASRREQEEGPHGR